MADPDGKDEFRWFQKYITFEILLTVLVTQFFKQRSVEFGAFAIILALMGIGGLVLWDQDRWRRAGVQAGPLPLHVLAILLGVIAAEAINSHAKFPAPYLVRLFVAQFAVVIFFLLLELSIDKSVRKNMYYSLPGMTCFLAYLIVSPRPLFDPKVPDADWGAVAFLGGSVCVSAIHTLNRELDPVPLQRRFVYIWAGISIAVLSCFLLFSAR